MKRVDVKPFEAVNMIAWQVVVCCIYKISQVALQQVTKKKKRMAEPAGGAQIGRAHV
jgi:hypothetical protein